MIVQTIKVNDCTPQTIVIGRRGTYDTLQIAFDLSYLVESYGNGVAVLAVKRSQDESAYPAVTSQEDDLLLWTVSETDTFYVGAGEVQLMWYVDGGLAKTIIYPMVVMKDILMTSEEAPDAYQTWVDDLTALGAETLQNAQDAAQSASDAETAKDDAVAAKEAAEAALEEFTTPTASATTLSAGSQATATYSDGNFAFGIPKGADGDPGDPGVTPDFSIGTVTTLEPTQPATATITGTAEAPVLNLGIPKGAKGDPGQGGGSVNSVNGKTGDVVLNAGDLEFDDTETYAAGSVGAELSAQSNAISQLDTQADTQDLLTNMDTGMVNYQYDTYYKRNANPSASDSTKLGVERNKQMVTLDGGGLSGDAIIVRLTGNIATTILTKTVKGWSSTLQLLSGHYYRVKLTYISGTQNELCPSVSVYKVGSVTTSGYGYRPDDYHYVRDVLADGGYYNLCLYVSDGYSYQNAKYLITLEDLTTAGSDSFGYFDGIINDLHHLINYGYEDYREILIKDTSNGNSGAAVGVNRYGTDIILDYDGTNYYKRVRISGNAISRSSDTSYRDWTGNLQLTEGKEYRAKIVHRSGTGALNGSPYIPTLVVYGSKGTSTIATQVSSTETSKEFSFTAPSGPISLAIFIEKASVLTGFACSVYLYEAEYEGGEVNDYYLTELADTVEKSRNEFTAPALVFMWATDIHRLSSNADGVQNFGNMIANMKALSKKVPCDFVLCTGDLTDGDQAKDTTLSRAYDCMTDFRSIGVPFVWAHGNHDNNPYISSGSLVLSLPECYKAYFESAEGSYNASENGTEYYIDFDRLNTRLISLNANNSSADIKYAYGQSTATWLASALDTDKNVIITLHQSPITSQVYDNTSTDGAAAIRSAITTFVNSGGNVIMLSGHSHNDIAFVSPYLSVMQDCQRFSDLAEDVTDQAHGMSGFIDVVRKCARVQNTATEDLWSVGVYKPDTNELSLIRFGAGKDRYFHVTPIAPTTLTSKLSGTLTWNSSDDAVATVADGVVTGVATGRCAILAHDESDNYECWIIEVA